MLTRISVGHWLQGPELAQFSNLRWGQSDADQGADADTDPDDRGCECERTLPRVSLAAASTADDPLQHPIKGTRAVAVAPTYTINRDTTRALGLSLPETMPSPTAKRFTEPRKRPEARPPTRQNQRK